jgi:hypothetical protein
MPGTDAMMAISDMAWNMGNQGVEMPEKNQGKNFGQLMMGKQKSHQCADDHP